MADACQITQPAGSQTFFTALASVGFINEPEAPITLFAWVKPTGGRKVVQISNSGGYVGYHGFKLQLVDGNVEATVGAGYGWVQTGPYENNVWQPMGAVFRSTTGTLGSITAFLNGVPSASLAVDYYNNQGWAQPIDTIYIATEPTTTTHWGGVGGCVAHVAIWKTALSNADMANLALGASPTTIHPSSLILYAPMLADVSATDTLAWDAMAFTVNASDPLVFSGNALNLATCATGPVVDAPNTPPEVNIAYKIPVFVGLPYCSQGQLMRPDQGNDAGAAAGPAFAKTRRIHKYGLDVYRSRGVSVGVDFDTVADGGSLRPVVFKSLKGTALPAPELFTGTVDGTVESKYDKEGKLAWSICRPYPLVIRAIGGFLATQDK